MKIITVVMADFRETFLGRPATLLTPVGGVPILRRTLERCMRIGGVDARCVAIRARDEADAAAALRGLELNQEFDLLAVDSGVRVRQAMLLAARKWNLESWRGGLLGATWYDEFLDAATIARALKHYQADAALVIDAAHAVVDPQIATAMVAHQRAMRDEAKFVFSQCPPGLAGIVVTPDALNDVLRMDIPFGLCLSYRPEIAQLDPIIRPSCFHVSPDVAQTSYRFVADTRRSIELIDRAIRELGDGAGADELCRWSREASNHRSGELPIEIELELTTDHPLPKSRLRLAAELIPQRELVDFEAIEARLRELGSYDDRLMMIGGHGDPLRHPRFADICRMAREAGVCGIGVETAGLDLTDAHIEALIANRIDVIEVRMDATTRETYARVHGEGRYDDVRSAVAKIDAARRARNAAQPLVVPSITRHSESIGEMEAFFDAWIPATGSAIIRGYNEFCGELPQDTLLQTVAPIRASCRRLASRLTLLANGTVARCFQDFRGGSPLGEWRTQSLSEIWQGAQLSELRQVHGSDGWASLELCRTCREWNRA